MSTPKKINVNVDSCLDYNHRFSVMDISWTKSKNMNWYELRIDLIKKTKPCDKLFSPHLVHYVINNNEEIKKPSKNK